MRCRLINTINSIVGVDLAVLLHRSRRYAGKASHGGYCGPAVKPIALHLVSAVTGDPSVRIPVSGIGGIATWQRRGRVHRAGFVHRAGLHGGDALRVPHRRGSRGRAEQLDGRTRLSHDRRISEGARFRTCHEVGGAGPQLPSGRARSIRTSASAASCAGRRAKTARTRRFGATRAITAGGTRSSRSSRKRASGCNLCSAGVSRCTTALRCRQVPNDYTPMTWKAVRQREGGNWPRGRSTFTPLPGVAARSKDEHSRGRTSTHRVRAVTGPSAEPRAAALPAAAHGRQRYRPVVRGLDRQRGFRRHDGRDGRACHSAQRRGCARADVWPSRAIGAGAGRCADRLRKRARPRLGSGGEPRPAGPRGPAAPFAGQSHGRSGAPPRTTSRRALWDRCSEGCITFSLPLGNYDNDRRVNVGANRWSIKPELGDAPWLCPITGSVAYCSLSAACVVLAARAADRGRTRLAAVGPLIAWFAVIAAALDALEDVAILLVLGGSVPASPGPRSRSASRR